MTLMDEDTQAQVQSFVSWATSKGYHVIGALIGPKGETKVHIFATTPEGDFDAQEKHAKKLASILSHAIEGQSSVSVNLPLGQN